MRNYINKKLDERYIRDVDDEDDDSSSSTSIESVYPSEPSDYNTRIVLSLNTYYWDSTNGDTPKWFVDNEDNIKETVTEFFEYQLLDILESYPQIIGYGDWKFTYQEFDENKAIIRVNPPHNDEKLPYFGTNEKAFFNPGSKYVHVSLKTNFRTPWQILRFINSFFRLKIMKNENLINAITMTQCDGKDVYFNISRGNQIRTNGCTIYHDAVYNFIYHLLPKGKMLHTYFEISGEHEFDKHINNMFTNQTQYFAAVDSIDDINRFNRVRLYDAYPMRCVYRNNDWKTLDDLSQSSKVSLEYSCDEIFKAFKEWFKKSPRTFRMYLNSTHGQFGYLCYLTDTFVYKDQEFIVSFFDVTNCGGNYQSSVDFFMDMADMFEISPSWLLEKFKECKEFNYSVGTLIDKRLSESE